MRVEERLLTYMRDVVAATRADEGVQLGAGPRGSLALLSSSRALATLRGRDFVTPDDVKRHALPVLRHRVLLSPDAQLEGRKTDELLSTMLDSVEAPRL